MSCQNYCNETRIWSLEVGCQTLWEQGFGFPCWAWSGERGSSPSFFGQGLVASPNSLRHLLLYRMSYFLPQEYLTSNSTQFRYGFLWKHVVNTRISHLVYGRPPNSETVG